MSTFDVSHLRFVGAFPPVFFMQGSPCTTVSTYLYNDMASQSIDDDGVLPQSQRRHDLFPKLLDVPLNLSYSSLMKISTTFGEVIDWQLL